MRARVEAAFSSACRAGLTLWNVKSTRQLSVGAGTAVAAAAVALGGVLMLLPGQTSLWLDETVSVAIARLDWSSTWSILAAKEGNGGLYYVLLHLWRLPGEAELWLRMLSIAAALGTIVVVFLLGKRLFGAGTGSVAAVLVVVNGLFLTEATEIRTYAVTTLLVSWSTLLLVKALQDSSPTAWIGYALTGALSLYGHVFAVFVVAGQLLFLLLASQAGKVRREALRAVALMVVLALPIGVFAIANGGQIGWIGRPTLEKIAGTFSVIAGGLAGARATAPLDRLLGAVLALGYAAGFVAAVVGMTRLLRGRRKHDAWPYVLLCSVTVTPVVAALTVSLLIQPVFYYKYFSLIVPLLAVLVAAGYARLTSRRIAAGAIAVLCLVSIVAVEKCYGDCNREDWKQAAQFVAASEMPGDVVVVYAPYARTAFDYYAPQEGIGADVVYPAYAYTSDRYDLVREPAPDLVGRIAAEHERVWLVLSHAGVGGELPGSRVASWFEDEFDGDKPEDRGFEGVRVLLFEHPPRF